MLASAHATAKSDDLEMTFYSAEKLMLRKLMEDTDGLYKGTAVTVFLISNPVLTTNHGLVGAC